MLKKAFALLLITLILLQSTGLIVYQAIESYLIHCEMKQKIKMERTDWIYFVLTEEQFENASIGESELNLSGKYYDISSIDVTGNIFYIKALHDKEEENIFSELNKFFGKNCEKSRSALRHLQKFDFPYICTTQVNFHCYYNESNRYIPEKKRVGIPGFHDPDFNPPELS